MLTGISSFSMSKKHVLPILISSELMVLSLIGINMIKEARKARATITVLTLIVCEGAAGLTIMIKSTKSKGNDLVSNTLV